MNLGVNLLLQFGLKETREQLTCITSFNCKIGGKQTLLHGGPGAAGSAFGLARLISKEFGALEPMQTKYTIMELEEELREQIENNCSGKVILVEKYVARETEEFDQILRQLEEGFGEKDRYLRRLGEICDRADGYQEEKSLSDRAEVNGDLHEILPE